MRRGTLFIALFCLAVVVGCGETGDGETLALRQKLILSTAPTNETSISKIRKLLMGPKSADETEVVLRGRIWAGEIPPWEEGKAAFVLTDATGHDGDDDHDPHACPFCSRDIDDYIAAIRFRNDDGAVAAIDSRELFDVKEKQMVIIKGRGSMNGDRLRVDATNIFIAR
ncbi:MAG: hypothetical protein GY758_16575 [Fuerstiella sp.]|nr:hypothetical protein [Fuerstiella sp.]MCP4512994.1 hypothetical protein [Fuerstiella sp.]MDG2129980.1 hypothetical protein [Fuerstiella sp.]